MGEHEKGLIGKFLGGLGPSKDWIAMMKILAPTVEKEEDFLWGLLEERVVKDGFHGDAVAMSLAIQKLVDAVGLRLSMV